MPRQSLRIKSYRSWHVNDTASDVVMPLFGLNCFVVAGVRDELSVQDVFKRVIPFFIADAVTIALLVAFPMIVLWLPSQI